MRKIFNLIAYCFITALLFSCDFNYGFAPENITAKAPEAVFDVVTNFIPLDEPEKSSDEIAHTVYVRSDEYVLSMYEPFFSCYLGAYIEDDNILEGDIGMFERMSGVNHAVYAYKHIFGEQFPEKFILQSLARSKVPLVEICFENVDIESESELIEELAVSFGAFDVPMFISFNATDAELKKEESKALYIKIREAFKENAPRCAFIWKVGTKNSKEIFDYYPGDNYVDWVGISAFSDIIPDSEHGEIFERLDEFYNTFQARKPIIITELGVSGFSNIDYSYKTSEASTMIKDIYKKIESKYPRIKAVIYASYTNDSGRLTQSYQLTESERLLEAYAIASENSRFTSDFDIKSKGEISRQWMLSKYSSVVVGDKIFILMKSFNDDFKILNRELSGYVDYLKVINDDYYLDSEVLKDFGFKRFAVDANAGKVFISRN